MSTVDGTTAPGFGAVERVLAEADLGVGGAAFAAYVDGQQVVDLWTGDAGSGEPWAKDTLTTMMSTTKGVAATCALVLHDRGLLDVEAPVAQYWPEYAQAGKERTTVRQVLDHTCGMLCFADPGSLLDWTGHGWDDYDQIARRIAASPPAWEPGTRIGYHAISIGWLLQELVRRIDGRSLGRFFADEIAGPLGLELYIGTPEDVQPRLAEVIGASVPKDASLASRGAQRATAAAGRLLVGKILSPPGSPLFQAMISMHGRGVMTDLPSFVNRPEVRALEIPSANASGDARSLARMYAALAGGGALDGTSLVAPASVELFRTPSSKGRTALMPSWLPTALTGPPMSYALGYEGDFAHPVGSTRFGPTLESFGHLGAGGQIGFADPVRKVAVGFLRNSLADWSVSTRLVKALYACL